MGKKETGWVGENIACLYLKDNKYKIIDRNVREKWGEIDIVSRAPNGVLVFVEVKALSGENDNFSPEQHYNFHKSEKFHRAGRLFAAKHETLLRPESGFRFDLISIKVRSPLLTDWKKDCEIRHYENI